MIKESIETQEEALEKEHRDDEYFERKERALKVYQEIVKNFGTVKPSRPMMWLREQDAFIEKLALMWK